MAESGADELSVFRRCATAALLGRIPTAAYPTDVRVTPDGKTLVWIGAKGLGTGPNPNGPGPASRHRRRQRDQRFQYLP